MKNYKEFEKMYIGASDGACLTVKNFNRSGNLVDVGKLYFGKDGEYSAYVTYGDVSVGDHYKMVHECAGPIVIADDSRQVFIACAESVEIYQAGEFGCIIHLNGEYISFGRLDIAEYYSVEDGKAVAL